MIDIFLQIGLYSTLTLAGQDVGNGGDVVDCVASSDSPFQGTYSLDYLVTYQESNLNQDIVKVASISESLGQLRKLLSEKLPEYIQSFDEFSKLILNKDILKPRIWEEAPFGLIDIHDENLISLVPTNCRVNNTLRITQAVVRQTSYFTGVSDEKLIYKYVPKIFQKLEKESPLQLSFVLIHEWLWDLSHNVDRNRRLNRFFHSQEFQSLSKDQVREKLSALGLLLSKKVPPDEMRFDYCSADPGYAKNLAAQVREKKRIELSNEILSLLRKTQCEVDDVGGCEVGRQIFYELEPRFSPLISAVEAGNQITIQFEHSKPYVMPAILQCLLDEASADLVCGPNDGTSVDGMRFGFPASLSSIKGTVGANGCIRLYDYVNRGGEKNELFVVTHIH